MSREGKRPLAAFIAAVLVATALGACGGSDSDSSGSTEASTATATTNAQDGSAEAGAPSDKAQAQDGQRGQGSQGEGGEDGSKPKNVATPLEVSGGGAGQFRVKGGDNSIQEYGEESDEAELQEVAEIVHSFYVARAEERWDEACSYLAKPNIEQLEQLASRSSKFKNAGCGPILDAFTQSLPASIQREITTVDAGSFRHEGEQGFLIYFGAGGTVYAMSLRDEDGTWKVAALSGTTLS